MKISNSTPNYVNQTYANQANNAATQNLKSQKTADDTLTDSINLSGRTKDLQKISTAMDTESVDRKKYVADIKLQVENNQYNINAQTVAEKMAGYLMNEIG
ncbi:MAG: flagellar biosynthesis anti-sigma factor FlgM [Desulfobacula sp.]|nr:flagellar biosynthesis anti-sigma factor FlgM [Desulfobacula sp.]